MAGVLVEERRGEREPVGPGRAHHPGLVGLVPGVDLPLDLADAVVVLGGRREEGPVQPVAGLE